MSPEREMVWLTEERRVALLVRMDAYYSTVEYVENGLEYEVQVANDDIIFFPGEDTDGE